MSKEFLAESCNTECVQAISHSTLNKESSKEEKMSNPAIPYTSKIKPDVKVTLKFSSKAEGDKAALAFENQLRDLVLEKIHRLKEKSALQSSDQRKAKEEP